MRKFLSLVLAVAVSLGFLGGFIPKVEGGTTINAVFSGYGATLAHVFETGDDHFWGSACWRNVGDSNKFEMNLDPSVFGISFTIDQIQSISYHTKKETPEDAPDFYLVIYSQTDGSNDHGWYGYKLIAEPYFSESLNAPSGQWNEWSTDPGTNQLTFFDPDTIGSFGFYGQPTLQDIQNGPIDWNSYKNTLPETSIDYGNEVVKYISFQTASNWTTGFSGCIDAISISLTDGTVVNIDLENTLWVDDDWNGKLPTTPVLLPDGRTAFFGGNAFAKIQDAIDAAQSGDTIVVAPGTYQENLTVKKTLTLLGAQANVDPRPSKGGRSGPESIIESSGSNSTSACIYITGANVELNGFTFKSQINNGNFNVVYAHNAQNPCILYNIVYNDAPLGKSSNEGIKVRYAYDSGAMVSYNYVYDIPSPGDAINFDSVNNGVISFNEVRNIGSENAAIYIYSSQNTTIQGNLVDGTTQNDGIKLGNKGGGDAPKTGGKIIDNVVKNTAQDGISVYTSNVLVEGNEVTGCTSENGAIYLAFGISNVTIRCNNIHDNNLNFTKWGNPGGIMIGTAVDASKVTVECNNIYHNSPYGLTNKTSQTLNAKNNWWGDPSGPGGFGPGKGDKVSNYVDYDPWLRYPACLPELKISANLNSVTVNEGQIATNTGTFNPTTDFESIGASIGNVTENLTDGTWSWSYQTVDDESTQVTITVTDTWDRTAQTTFDLAVNNLPPECGTIQVPPAPVQINTPVDVSCTFTDPGTQDTHTATWNWGDGSISTGTVTETDGSGKVSGQHIYSTPGVYQVNLTLSDDDGGTCTCAAQTFIVVYDPSAGFVTGGGWINSPPGAYTPNSSLTGKATFGFVAKYQKGANVPSGNTEFQFKAGNLNFKSTSYEWLVVAGNKAKFKGEGTLNGVGGYKFMLTAVDGQYNKGTAPDTFRIKIWRGEEVIYDNMLGASDDSYDGTVLGGGEIVIHK
ncbi:MAG: PKD domain-containing protein [Caldiserica bacterium]|jgi:hypothetical protein|nr:PKD domain-containing protein [Caldisericota bacterium]MDH7562591.1 PKD domain-containing protein [Caldisericota bacterium]